MECLPCNESSNISPDNTDNGSSPRHNDEAGEPLGNIGGDEVLLLDLDIGLEHVVEDNSYCIVEKWFSEYDDIKNLVHLNTIDLKFRIKHKYNIISYFN